MVLVSHLKNFSAHFCGGGNKVRKSEKSLRHAARNMANPYRQRIDLLRSASGIPREAFDTAIMDLIARRKVDLDPGKLSERIALTDAEFMNLIDIDGTVYLYLIWPDMAPSTSSGIDFDS